MMLRQREHPDDRTQRLKIALMSGNVWCDEAAEAVEEFHQEMAEKHFPQRRPRASLASVILALVVPILILVGAGVVITGLLRMLSACSGNVAL